MLGAGQEVAIDGAQPQAGDRVGPLGLRPGGQDSRGIGGDLFDEGLADGGLDPCQLVVDGADGNGQIGALVGLADRRPDTKDDLREQRGHRGKG